MIPIAARADAIEFLVRATPRAPRDEVRPPRGDALVVAVTAPPEDGKANAGVERLLADFLGVKAAAVAVVSGAASRTKKVRARGVSPDEARRRIAALEARGA